MTQYGMGDDATIDEVINDVDADNVRKTFISSCFYFGLKMMINVKQND